MHLYTEAHALALEAFTASAGDLDDGAVIGRI